MKHAETKTLLNSCWDETAVKLSYYFDKKKLILDACLVTFMSLMLLIFQILETSSVILKY